MNYMNYKIDATDLSDMIICAQTGTQEYWKSKISLGYPKILVDHPIINQFKFFTVYPSRLYFYINDKGSIRKEAVSVKSKIFNENEFIVKPTNMIFFAISEKDDKTIIRYAETDFKILT